MSIRKSSTTNKNAEKYQKELEKVISTRNKFFAIVAHDVKGPIGNILQLANLMRDPNNRGDEMVDVLYNAASQTVSLLDNLLTWSRSQQGLIHYSPAIVNIHELANDCIGLLRFQARAKGITLENNCEDNLLATADMNMVQTLMRNLLDNAIKFTGKGGKVSIAAKAIDSNMLEIRVNDNGKGMPAEYAAKLFSDQKVVSCIGTEGEKGTGLGLVLSHEFVERNRGKLGVESERDKGSSFWFTLPMYIQS